MTANGANVRNEMLAVRLTDTERRLLEAAASKEQVSQSELARRGLLRESRAILTSGEKGEHL